MISRLEAMTEFQQFALPGVGLFGLEADRWQDRLAVLRFNPEDEITTAPIMEIIGEGADRVEDSFRIPAFFELNTLRLDRPAVEKSVDIDGQWHGRMRLAAKERKKGSVFNHGWTRMDTDSAA